MKKLSAIVFALLCWGCQQPDRAHDQQQQIDDLKAQLSQAYTPGLGEFMGGIQVHHAKLWFAGKNKNWELADFEVVEIKEMLEDIQKYCADRPEVKMLGMIDPAMDSISHAVNNKDSVQFLKSFKLLTNTCNNCHRATSHGFNVITIPDRPPVGNQVFKPSNQ